jgi:biopolymer transport protein ExbB
MFMIDLKFIHVFTKLYADGGIVVIPLGILSIIGLSIFFQKTFCFARRLFKKRSSVPNEIPYQFSSYKPYYQSFLCKAALSRTPSKSFIKETQDELNKLEKGLWFIELIIQLAPILGILGTIIGVMQSIQGVDLSQELGMKLVSKGFSKALITSIFGLSLACTFQLVYSTIRSNLQNIQNQFSNIYYELVEWESNGH